MDQESTSCHYEDRLLTLEMYVVSLDFDKKAKKEACPLLEQFLCHIAKTGETL